MGWDPKYLFEFAYSIGLTLVPVEVTSFGGIWELPGQNQCDIAASGISDLPDRRKTGTEGVWSIITIKLFAPTSLAAKKGELKTVRDMRGKTVIITADSTADSDLVNRLRHAQDRAWRDSSPLIA